jgi:hypothetical protein
MINEDPLVFPPCFHVDEAGLRPLSPLCLLFIADSFQLSCNQLSFVNELLGVYLPPRPPIPSLILFSS